MIKLQKLLLPILATIVIVFLASFDLSKGHANTQASNFAYQHYRIVTGHTTSELETSVKSHLRDGWEPAGGVTVDKDIFYQAIVK